MTISSNTKLLAVIGDPIAHSQSPSLHNYLIKHLNLDYVYLAIHISSDDLAKAVEGFRAIGIAGFNVTVPHKQAIIPHLDELSPEAEKLGAVNTVVIENGKLIGRNTDWVGFSKPLEGIELKDQSVVLLGAGGAAKGVAYALTRLGIGQLTIANRTPEKAEALAKQIQSEFNFSNVAVAAGDGVATAVASASLLVNSTSVGMWPEVEVSPIQADCLHEGLMVYDLVYNPLETQLIKDAKHCGASTIDGLGMLIHQGVAAFEMWTGEAVFDTLIAQVRDHLINSQRF